MGILIHAYQKGNLIEYPYYNNLVEGLLKRDAYKKYTREDFDKMMDYIEQIESGGKNIQQDKGGPAKGYFQIEPESLKTAYNRYNGMIDEYPELKGLPKMTPDKSYNAMKLGYKTQKALALANLIKAAVAKGDIIDPTRPEEMWIKYYWAGSKEDEPYKRKMWEDKFGKTDREIYPFPYEWPGNRRKDIFAKIKYHFQ